MYTAIRDALEKNTCVISLGGGRSAMVLSYDIQIMIQTKIEYELGRRIYFYKCTVYSNFDIMTKYIKSVSLFCVSMIF